eukprot:351269-Chlamydomonas_euryale.AAC.7
MADANTAPAAPAMSAAGSAALPSALSAASSAAAAVPAAQAQATRRFASGAGHDPSTTTTFGYAADDDDDDSVRTDRPDELTMNEITMMLKAGPARACAWACAPACVRMHRMHRHAPHVRFSAAAPVVCVGGEKVALRRSLKGDCVCIPQESGVGRGGGEMEQLAGKTEEHRLKTER